MLNSIITCNASLKSKYPVLNSHNNFQKEKPYLFKKSKFWTKFFFSDTGFQVSKLYLYLQFLKFSHFESLLDFDKIFQKGFILHFWVELREFFQNIYIVLYVTSSSTKILEIENEKLSVKSIFSSFFPFWKPNCHKSICLNCLNFAFWWRFHSMLSRFER